MAFDNFANLAARNDDLQNLPRENDKCTNRQAKCLRIQGTRQDRISFVCNRVPSKKERQ